MREHGVEVLSTPFRRQNICFLRFRRRDKARVPLWFCVLRGRKRTVSSGKNDLVATGFRRENRIFQKIAPSFLHISGQQAFRIADENISCSAMAFQMGKMCVIAAEIKMQFMFPRGYFCMKNAVPQRAVRDCGGACFFDGNGFRRHFRNSRLFKSPAAGRVKRVQFRKMRFPQIFGGCPGGIVKFRHFPVFRSDPAGKALRCSGGASGLVFTETPLQPFRRKLSVYFVRNRFPGCVQSAESDA